MRAVTLASLPFAVAICAPGACGCGAAAGAASPGDRTLRVEGNHLTFQGKPTRLLGVNHSGTEYTCLKPAGSPLFEGPDADTLAAGILTWGHVNTVRIPLNEDCWLGINGVPAGSSGPAYRNAIVAYAGKLHAHGLFTILDLHWNAPGAFQATTLQPMADADHAPAFWTSVAGAFKGDGMAVLDLYNEPYIDASNAATSDPWACWAHGCTITQSTGGVTGSWQSAGMASLVAAVRSTGASNVLLLGGLSYANDLSGWLAHVPSDPLGQIAASFHVYADNACSSLSCWEQVVAPVTQKFPVVAGEIGERDCGHGFIDGVMSWADGRGVGYLGWTWNIWDCSSGPSLISSYDGTPTAFGQGLRDHLQATAP